MKLQPHRLPRVADSVIAASLAAALIAGAASAALAAPQSEERLALKAAEVVIAPGKTIPRGVVIVEGGRITAVGTDLGIPRGARVADFGSATIAAGLVDASTEAGAEGEITDATFAFTPGVRAIDAFRPEQRAFLRAVSEGVTSVALAPGDGNVISGVGAVVKTGGPSRILMAESFLKLSVTGSALGSERYPTSVSTALAELRARFAAVGKDPAAAKATDDATAREMRFLARARKDLRPWFAVSGPTEVRQVLRLAKDLELKPVLIARGDLVEAAAEIAEAKVPVCLGPLGFDASRAELRQPLALDRAGVEIAFASMQPSAHPLSLRLTASLAIASGLDRNTALAAISSTPARWLGVADRVGTVEVGRDADLVVYSGDPTNLASSVVAVYVNGARVLGPHDGRQE